MTSQLDEIRQAKRIQYNNKKREELEEKTRLDKIEQIRIQDDKIRLDKIEQKRIQDKKYKDEKYKEEETMINKHQEYLNNSLEKITIKKHQEYLDDSLVIIYSILENCKYENKKIDCDFINNAIVKHFYHQVTTAKIDDLYIFYVNLKKLFISGNIDDDIKLIINTFDLINFNCKFVDILHKSNKLEYIEIIFQEFIKIIEHINPNMKFKC